MFSIAKINISNSDELKEFEQKYHRDNLYERLPWASGLAYKTLCNESLDNYYFIRVIKKQNLILQKDIWTNACFEFFKKKIGFDKILSLSVAPDMNVNVLMKKLENNDWEILSKEIDAFMKDYFLEEIKKQGFSTNYKRKEEGIFSFKSDKHDYEPKTYNIQKNENNKNMGIKIPVSEKQSKLYSDSNYKEESNVKPKVKPKVETKVETKVESKVEPKVDSKIETEVEPKVELKIDSKADSKVEFKAESDTQVNNELLNQLLNNPQMMALINSLLNQSQNQSQNESQNQSQDNLDINDTNNITDVTNFNDTNKLNQQTEEKITESEKTDSEKIDSEIITPIEINNNIKNNTDNDKENKQRELNKEVVNETRNKESDKTEVSEIQKKTNDNDDDEIMDNQQNQNASNKENRVITEEKKLEIKKETDKNIDEKIIEKTIITNSENLEKNTEENIENMNQRQEYTDEVIINSNNNFNNDSDEEITDTHKWNSTTKPYLNYLIENNKKYISPNQRTAEDDNEQIYTTEKRHKYHLTNITKDYFDHIFQEVMKYFTTVERLKFMRLQKGDVSRDEFLGDVKSYVSHQFSNLNQNDQKMVMNRIENATCELYILDDLINDDKISDIRIIAYNKIRIKIYGKNYTADTKFVNEDDYQMFIQGIALRNNINLEYGLATFTDKHSSDKAVLRFDITTSKINSSGGSYVHIRKVDRIKKGFNDLIEAGMLDETLADYVIDKIKNAKGMIIAGQSASGKTTFANALIDYIPMNSTGTIIQENEELFTNVHPDIMCEHIGWVVPVKGQPVYYGLEELTRNALLTNTEYIIVGEIKGAEARDFTSACATSHKCLATIHAGSAKDVPMRLADLMKYGSDYTIAECLRMLKDLEVIIYMSHYKIMEIMEITGFDDKEQTLMFRSIYKREEL